MTTTRTRAARGSTPAPGRNSQPPAETPAEKTSEPAPAAHVISDDEKRMIAEVKAAGWKIKVGPMHAACTREGFAPVTAHCSNSIDAVTIVWRDLVVDADIRPPIVATTSPTAAGEGTTGSGDTQPEAA